MTVTQSCVNLPIVKTILAIETATQACSAAVLFSSENNVECHERFEIAPQKQSDLILPMIDALLSSQNISRAQIDAIALGCGPGSFMGTRLAVGVAQGLGYALECPLIPISTLQIIAQQAYETEAAERVIAGWDARMGEVYWGEYVLRDGVMAPVTEDRLSAPNRVSFDRQTDFVLAGNAWPDEKTVLHECYPHAAAALTIALPRLIAGEVVAPMDAMPVYLRNKVTY